MKAVFENFIEELNSDSKDRKLSDYKREKEVYKEYNGRQLLELLQNIDDQSSKEALVKLDTKNKILIIANKGNPFSKGGLKSLMMANLSSKDKTFIGNKGLGFRSLLNWSGKIYVKSSDVLSIEFSEKNRNELQPDGKRAILSSPKWIADNNSPEWIENIDISDDYITYIAVNYTEKSEEYIVEQMKEITEELMFFINHIQEIHFELDGNKKTFKKKKWKIKPGGGEIPSHLHDEDNEKIYEFKLIIPPEGEVISPFLFSYFPTKIKIDFPALIHATFELDSSRNTIVDTEANRHVVKKLADFIIDTAEGFKSDEANWKTYEFLDFKDEASNSVLEKFGFYKIINDWKEDAEIYPCIDNKYRDKKSYAFYTNGFSDFMENHSELAGYILKRNKYVREYSRYYVKFSLIVNKISKKIKSISERIEFINHILDINNHRKIEDEELIVLVNQDNQLKSDIFFYEGTFEGLEIPDFIEIDYVHPDLQKGLDRHRILNLVDVKEFNLHEDLIDKIIDSNEAIQLKLKALYSIFLDERRFEKPSKKIEGITGKYIRDDRILSILDEEEIIEEYKHLGIECFKKKEDFLVWLGAKPFKAREILKKVIKMNQKKNELAKTLNSLMILKDELDEIGKLTIKIEDIYTYDANLRIKKVNELFPYHEDCEQDIVSASKEELGLEEYSDKKVQEFLKWLGIKEYNPGNLALEKIKQLKEKNLSEERVKSILKFLYRSKGNGELNEINPSEVDIYILGKLNKNLKLRRKLTEKYFSKDELIDEYSYLGLEKSEATDGFLKWLGVKEATDNAIVNRIFKSGSSIAIKIKDLFSIFSKNEKIKQPEINFRLKSLNGEIRNARDLYFNDSTSKFFKPEKIIGDLDITVSREFLEWLGVSEPKREDFVKILIELLSKKDGIPLELRKDAIAQLSKEYERSDEIPKDGLFLVDSQNNIKISFKLYKETEIAKKHIPNELINSELDLDNNFLEWLRIEEADPLEIMEMLLKMADPNLKEVYDIWKIDRYGELDRNIEVKIKNLKGVKTLVKDLFLKKEETPFYKECELVASFTDLNLEDPNEEKIEKFLVWLGVNKYIKYQETEKGKEVYCLKEISKLKFSALISLLEKENVLKNRGALRDLQDAIPQYKYWILKDKNITLINPPLDYENKPNILKILKEFEIAEDFNEDNSLFLLQNLEQIDPNGEYAPQIYKELTKYNFKYSEDFKIFTKDKKYIDNNIVYYLDNTKTPKSIRDVYSFIDLPLSLNTNSVVSTFKVQRLPEFNFSVEEFKNGDVGKQLHKHLDTLNPYFLAFGSKGMEANNKKEIALKLKNLNIKVGNFNCMMKGVGVGVEDYEMVGYGDKFYIKVEKLESNFRQNKNMTGSIQNILLTIFDEKYKRDIRDIFKYADFEELNSTLVEEYGSNALKEAEDLLGKTINFNKKNENINLQNNLNKYTNDDYEEEDFKENIDDSTEKEKYVGYPGGSIQKREVISSKEKNSYNHTINNKVLKNSGEDSSNKAINNEDSLWVKVNHQEEIAPPIEPKSLAERKISSNSNKSREISQSLDDNLFTQDSKKIISSNDRKPVYIGKTKEIDEEKQKTQRVNAKEIGDRGENYIIEHQAELLLSPSSYFEKAVINNKGFDIYEKDSNEEITRYIEVKTLTGHWGEGGVGITEHQLKFAQEKKEKWWLFVVENVNTEITKIYQFKNPVLEANRFMFDGSWKQLSYKSDEKLKMEPKIGDYYIIEMDGDKKKVRIENVKRKGALLQVELSLPEGYKIKKKFNKSWEKLK